MSWKHGTVRVKQQSAQISDFIHN